LLSLRENADARAVAAPGALHDADDAALERMLRNVLPRDDHPTSAKFEFGAMGSPVELEEPRCCVATHTCSALQTSHLFVSPETEREN
jgi:hypothetical protein